MASLNCHTSHREIKRSHIHRLFAWAIDDLGRIRIIHPHIRIWTLRHIR